MKIEIVNPSYLHKFWPITESLLSKAMDYSIGEMTLDQLKVYLANGQYGLMFFIDDNEEIVAALVFNWINYPNDRVFYIYAIAGETNTTYFDEVYKFAIAQGATVLRCATRESVARLCKAKFGWNKVCYVMEKRL